PSQERRPGGEPSGESRLPNPPGQAATSLDDWADTLPSSQPVSPQDVQRLGRRADYALRVVTTRRDGHTLTRYYAALSSAEAAVRRARERNAPVVVQLVRIVPTTVSVTDAVTFGLLPEGVAG